MSSANQDAVDYDDEADAMFRLRKPHKQAALWYSLYYAVEIEGVSEVAFEFRQLTRELAEAFYWYGIMSATRELGNCEVAFFIRGRTPAMILDDNSLNDWESHIEQYVAERLFADEPTMVGWAVRAIFVSTVGAANLLTAAGSGLNGIDTGTPRGAAAMLENADAALGVGHDPDDTRAYIRNVRQFFRATPDTRHGRDIIEQENETGWVIDFNGGAWVGICDHLLRRDGLSDTAWVDQSWSVEHNNQSWLDKIGASHDPDRLEEMGVRGGPFVALQDVLDAAQDGRMDRVFLWAQLYDADVDVNVRRLRREIGL